jgi:CHAT domain-containing protein
MELRKEDDGLIRRYLLAQLTEEEREQFEKRMMTDTELFDQMLLAEDDIADDYARGQLAETDRQAFEDAFLSDAEGRSRVNLAKSLHKYVAKNSELNAVAREQMERTSTQDESNLAPVASIGKDKSPRRLRWWQQPGFGSYVKLAAAAVIIIGVGLGIWRAFLYQSEVSKGIAALAYAYREQRPVEARISGLNYAPLAQTRGDDERFDRVARNRAERILLDEVIDHPSAAAHHALGRLYLAKKNFDDAFNQFDLALNTDPSNAQLHSDYGGALLEKARAEQSAGDLGKALEDKGKALEHLNKALELDRSLHEALFNRALVHQEIMLLQQAEDDWRKYLESDSNSQWAGEAKRNLDLLEERKQKTSHTKDEVLRDFLSAQASKDDEKAWKVVSQSREALSGKLLWEQLLDAYLEASIKGQKNEANNSFQALSYLGELEAQRADELYTSRLAQFYASLSRPERVKLVQARSQMKLGRQYYAQAEPLKALDTFSKARQLFAEIGDEPEAQYAQKWIGLSYLEKGDTQQGLAILEQLVQWFETKNFKWLMMRTLQSMSGAQYSIHLYSKGIDYGRQALALAESLNDKVGIFNTLSLLTEEFRYIANYYESLSCGAHSLALMESSFLNQTQVSRHFNIIASVFISCGLPAAAIDCEKEALRHALTIDHRQMISLAYAQLGAMYGRSGQSSEALINTELAYETAKSLSDAGIRMKMMATSSLQTGHLYREAGEFERAINSYDECIRLYSQLDLHYDLYQACKGKLLCFISLGNDSVARQELDRTLNVFEKYRSGILGGEDKNRYFDVEQSVYDIAIDFKYSRENDPREAFEFSEESHARSLLDSVTGNAQLSYKNIEPDIVSKSISRPLKFAEIQGRLPKEVQILQYAILSDKVLIWIVSKTAFSTVEKKIEERELNEKVVNYLQCLYSNVERNKQELRDKARELFDILITPANSFLDNNEPLYIIPDKILNYLPFGALISTDTDRFLLQDHALVISPSSSLLIICSETARQKEGASEERLMVVGNPHFDRKAFPTLPDLPSARREAEVIAAYYNSARLLIGDNAREERVKNEIARSDLVHFALHSVIDPKSPMQSKLLLTREQRNVADNNAQDGVLQAHEIYGLKLPRTRVVVLSACQTGIERYYKGEGMIGMARPFMAAGVPLVVVTLWPVDSDATAELMISFHRHRKLENRSTAEALRLAQLDLMNSSNERFHQPYYWAPFIAVGASAKF